MNINKILELQTAYIEAQKFQDQYNKEPICVEYNKVKEQRSLLKDEANKYIDAVNVQYKQLKEANEKFKELNVQINESLGEKYQDLPESQLAYMMKSLENDSKALNDISNEVMKINGNLSSSISMLNQTMSQYAQVNQKRDELKEKKDKYDTEIALPRMNELKDNIKKIKDAMNPSDVALYETTRTSLQESRVVVPMLEKSCGACGIELDAGSYQKIAVDGVCRCPNCGRIVFKK